MTQILRQRAFSCTPGEKIIKNPEELRTSTFENKVEEMFQPYIGMSRTNLKKRFGITSSAKNINELILSKMLGIKGKPKNADEFKKAYITPKTINKSIRDSIKAIQVENIGVEYKFEKEDDIKNTISKLTDEMLEHASRMEFEQAAELRDKIKELEKLINE